MLTELSDQVSNLDTSKYKVMLLWDPDNARDVGWLTVEKDVVVDTSLLQVRDVNLNKIHARSNIGAEAVNQEEEIDDVTADPSASSSIIEVVKQVNIIDVDNDIDNAITDNFPVLARYVEPSDGDGFKKKEMGHMVKLQCSECEIFVATSYFVTHMKSVHGRHLKTFEKVKCDICNFYVTKVNLDLHKKLKHGVDGDGQRVEVKTTLANCYICGKQLESIRSLRNHVRECIDSKNVGLSTDQVKTTEPVKSLRNHVRECGDTKEVAVSTDQVKTIKKNKVQCSDCRAYFSSSTLAGHMAMVHGKIVKFEKIKCDICGFLVNKINLDFHKKLKHKGESLKEFKCKSCGKELTSYRSFAGHRGWCKGVIEANSRTDTAGKQLIETKEKVNFSGADVREDVKKERVIFSIQHEGRIYSCSRSKGARVKGSLKKFCVHVGKDLMFKFNEKFLTGPEVVDTFSGGTIVSSPLKQ